MKQSTPQNHILEIPIYQTPTKKSIPPQAPNHAPAVQRPKPIQIGKADQFPYPKAKQIPLPKSEAMGRGQGRGRQLRCPLRAQTRTHTAFAIRQQKSPSPQNHKTRFGGDPKQSPPKRKIGGAPPTLGSHPRLPTDGTFGANTKPKSEGKADRFPLLHGL